MSTGSERRRFHRIPFVTGATLHTAHGPRSVTVHDLSLKGALVEMGAEAAPLKMGETCELVLPLDQNAQIVLKTRVARTHGQCLGLRCEQLDLDSAWHLRRLVELNLGDAALLQRDLNALIDSELE